MFYEKYDTTEQQKAKGGYDIIDKIIYKGEIYMKTIPLIRKELKEIRYYSMYRKDIDKALDFCPKHEVVDLLQTYNRAIEFAPIQLYHIYYKLYIKCHTQESLANDLKLTPEYIYKLHAKLIQFFYSIFNFECKHNVELNE